MASYGNKAKHESQNPIYRALVGRFKNEVVRMVRAAKPRTLLEIGCGEGYILEAIADANVPVALHGVDISESAIADAQTRLSGRAEVTVTDARELVHDARKFDMVLILEVLEHVQQPQQLLPIVAQLCAHQAILSVPWEPFFWGLNLLRGHHLKHWGNHPEHINHWTRAQFLKFVSRQFDVIETPLLFPWTMVLAAPKQL